MYNSLSYKTKQFFWLTIKLLVVIVCLCFIYIKLTQNNELSWSDFLKNLESYKIFSLKNILFLLLFSCLNHYFEILKWQVLVNSITKISFFEAVKQSLSSLTVSLITPNRIGEYGAKAIFFEEKKRKKIIVLNFIGNFYQMLTTFFFGFFGLLYFFKINNITVDIYKISIYLIILVICVLAFFLLVKMNNYIKDSIYKIKNFTSILKHKLKLKILFLSFLRYLIFSHQLYFLLHLFHLEISYLAAISAITTLYFIASIIPMLSIFDVVLKGSVAVWIFSFFNFNPILILSITTSMWLLNFVFPAILGSYFVLIIKPNYIK